MAIKSDHQEKRPLGIRVSKDCTGHRETTRSSSSGHHKRLSRKEAIGYQGINRPYGHQVTSIKKRPSRSGYKAQTAAIKQQSSKTTIEKRDHRPSSSERPHGHQADRTAASSTTLGEWWYQKRPNGELVSAND